MVLQLGQGKGQRLSVRLPFPWRTGTTNVSLCDPSFLIPRAGPRECCLSLMRFSPVLVEEKKISPWISGLSGNNCVCSENMVFINFW